MADVLQIVQEEDIAILTINRPEALNAINGEVMKSLHAFFTDVDSNLRGIILTGAGDKAFVAGADIKEFNFDLQSTQELGRFGHETFARIEQCSVPVIAAVNGFALGGGCELALACHLRVASKNAKFGQPEINLGIIPGYGGTQRLPQLIGKARALELLLTADMIDVEQALDWGLVNHVTEVGEATVKAREILNKIAQKAPLATSAIIRLVNRHYQDPVAGMREEPAEFARCFATEDAQEGVAAFLQKRKAEFKGR